MRSAPSGLAALLLAAVLLPSCSGPRPENVIILCAGDSLTELGYPRRLGSLIEKSGVRARVLNYGRSGFTSREYLRFLGERRSELRAELPDLILLQLGTNDVRLDGDRTTAEEFEDNMRRIVGVFAEFKTRWGDAPRIFLASIPPVPEDVGFPFSPVSSARVDGEINPILVRLAAELGLVPVDNFSAFRDSPELLTDVHPTEEGYDRLAANWLAAIKPFFPE